MPSHQTAWPARSHWRIFDGQRSSDRIPEMTRHPPDVIRGDTARRYAHWPRGCLSENAHVSLVQCPLPSGLPCLALFEHAAVGAHRPWTIRCSWRAIGGGRLILHILTARAGVLEREIAHLDAARRRTMTRDTVRAFDGLCHRC